MTRCSQTTLFLELLVVFLLAFTLPGRLAAQALTFDLTGYAKNLAIRSKSILNKDPFVLNISRLRAQGVFDAGERVHAEVWLDNELLTGDFFQTPDFQLSRLIERPKFADLDWVIDEGGHHQLRQLLFRAFATVYAGKAEVTVGRQRIAWGTGFAWNPTDLLNPFNPAAIELQEKEGVDAVHVALPLGELSRIEAAYAPGRGRLKSSYASKVSGHLGEYDFSFMSGRFRGQTAVGGDFAGYLGNAGFRGEFSYTFSGRDGNFLRAVVNTDFNFPHNFYALAEFYYNGQGESDKKSYNFFDLANGETFNLAKVYAALSVSKSLTPLLNSGVYAIFNLNDGSGLAGPTLTYSLATNLELSASGYFLFGASDSEYGQLESSYFGSLQYFF